MQARAFMCEFFESFKGQLLLSARVRVGCMYVRVGCINGVYVCVSMHVLSF